MPAAIYLASRSSARRELLKQIGVRFDPLLLRLRRRADPTSTKPSMSGESAAQYVDRTAREKATRGLEVLGMRSMLYRPVLAADTVVILDGEVPQAG
jgi:septum formation protein